MIKRDRFVLLNFTFAFNILALVAGILGFFSTYHAGGATFLFGIVLIVAPVLSIVVVIDRRWTNQTDE